MQIERAQPADLSSIQTMLVASALPLDGAANAFSTGMVARDGDAIVGAAAVEPYGSAGLLRSVVVVPDLRGIGIGASVVTATEALAAELGIGELYLLTDTAEAWFARRGYRPVERHDVPAAIRMSVEFTTACDDTAVAMKKRRLGS